MSRKETKASGMDGKDRTAFTLFAFLCLAGILTLFSQTSLQTSNADGSHRTSLNPNGKVDSSLDHILPRALESGAAFKKTPEKKAKAKAKAKAKSEGQVLRLR